MAKSAKDFSVEDENGILRRAILEYLSEIDNPVPDSNMRLILRDRLRALTGAPNDPRLKRA